MITSDEEERQRLGYHVTRHYTPSGDRKFYAAQAGDRSILNLSYDHSGKIVSINHGPIPSNRDEPISGFTLCTACNRWILGRNGVAEHLDQTNEMKKCWRRGTEENIIQNILLYTDTRHDVIKIDVPEMYDETGEPIDDILFTPFIKTLAQAIIEGIQISLNVDVDEVKYLLMVNPQDNNRSSIVLYETSEGGAGILESIVTRSIFHRIVSEALVILHEYEEKQCDRACYECLCNYYNQSDHDILDRKLVLPLLRDLLTADVRVVKDTSPTTVNHYEHLISQCESSLEKQVLTAIYQYGLPLPDSAQEIISENDE
ncbi:DUF1998 domain-containing protein [Methanocalculus sp. MSAO_Arc2]|uniref:DUF1998 domain-containing protein n=1 Tax=Methanocalculus sp. MSAO_Arc2 TaxID=2293855 RepID=UPI003216F6DA